MDISVVIPVCDRPRELKAALASVLAQTMKCSEIIIVDDASRNAVDASRLEADSRIRVIRHRENQGPAAARNTGLLAASGRYVAFLDSDDLWRPRKLETQFDLLRESGGGWRVAVVSGWCQSRGGKAEMILPGPAASLADFAKGCWFCPGSTLLIDRQAFDNVGLFDPRLRRLEDYEWFLRFAGLGGRLVVSPAPLADIHRHRATSPGLVAASAEIIANFYLSRQSAKRLDSASHRRLVSSYLALANAATLWYGGSKVKAARALARSFLARPRGHVHESKLFQVRSVD